jgi:hypothetical protein
LSIDDLKESVIRDGIAYVIAHQTAARQRAGVRGFEACCALHTPADFQGAIEDGYHEEKLLTDLAVRTPDGRVPGVVVGVPWFVGLAKEQGRVWQLLWVVTTMRGAWVISFRSWHRMMVLWRACTL